MILAMDVGNTNIKTGLFSGDNLVQSWRMSHSLDRTSDELGITMASFFKHYGIRLEEVDGIIISSVIPSMNFTLEHMCIYYFKKKPLFVGSNLKSNINIKYESPKELGSDRICSAAAAYALYGGPVIVIDFGTATTFNVITKNGDYLGGAICPGVKISMSALVENTAKLPKVELTKPKSIIGKSTIQCIQSGLVYGYVGQVDYIISRIMKELCADDIKVIATGGMANIIINDSIYVKRVNRTLTLQGLHLLYGYNKPE